MTKIDIDLPKDLKLPTALMGSLAKLERANECIRDLELEIDAYVKSPDAPYEIVRKFDRAGLEYEFWIKLTKAVPARIAVLSGDVAHNLSSSLDHIFNALVVHAGHESKKHDHFPIYSDRSKFETAALKKTLLRVSQSAREKLFKLQPFQSQAQNAAAFAVLRELNNTDKHRHLIKMAGACELGAELTIGRPDIPMVDINGNRISIVGFAEPAPIQVDFHERKYFSIRLGSPAPSFVADTQTNIELVFEACGGLRLVPIRKTLRTLSAAVRSALFDFAEEFT
jgi:hypothetical protein